jgi:phage shock protein C
MYGKMYRSRKGIIMGVCRGFAQYFDFNIFWVRVTTLILFFISGIWPITVLYFLAALVMKLEPVIPAESDDEQAFYDDHIYSGRQTVGRIRRKYEALERRICHLEDSVTGKEFDWNRRMNA